MSEYVLRTYALEKRYGHSTVLDRVFMNIEKGDIYGFVGENGSGKTTLIRTICGLIYPENGSYELFDASSTDDKEIRKARRRMGAIVETPSIYPNLTAKENLEMISIILGIKADDRIREVLNMVGLGYTYDDTKKVANYSLGMRQRLGIAISLLSNAEFMVLDEPLNGLDPEGIVEIRNLILNLNREHGITFLISSHILTELQLIATKYGIISKGHIIKEITSQELLDRCQKTITVLTSDKDSCISALANVVDIDKIKEISNGFVIREEVNFNTLMKALENVPVLGINTSTETIEDYYLSVISGGGYNA